MIFDQLEHKEFATPEGSISYWVTPHAGNDSQGAGNPCAHGAAPACDTSQAATTEHTAALQDAASPDSAVSQATSTQPWLVFLPGLTADHRLFEKQVEHFIGKAHLFVWDPPSHGESRPFALTWTMDDLARWLHEIFAVEGIAHPILIGQSMGGYTAQVFMDLFPGKAAGFVSIDSCSLQRHYYTWWELAALRHTKLMYLSFPWKTLVRLGSTGNTTTHYGSKLMETMMLDYQKREYCELAAHGFRVLADAVSADRPYQIDCPYLLICGEEDRAGSAKRYNRAWEAQEGTPVHWIENARHNSNCDNPAAVNELIERLLDSLASA